MQVGERELRQPHPLLETKWYLEQLKTKGYQVDRNLPAHCAAHQGLWVSPHPIWDSTHIKTQQEEPLSPIEYLKNSDHWWIDTHTLFDESYYREQARQKYVYIQDEEAPLLIRCC